MKYTFPHELRLKTPAEFKQVWSTAKRLSGQNLAIANSKNNLDYPRLGLSLSKKQIKKAVDRNQLKRIARETFRHVQSQLNGYDFIVVAYKGLELLTSKEQHERFETLWKRLATLCKKLS